MLYLIENLKTGERRELQTPATLDIGSIIYPRNYENGTDGWKVVMRLGF